ncbi:hypothetical protein ACA910_006639 [Epithemia clementina (nom. ined.)]
MASAAAPAASGTNATIFSRKKKTTTSSPTSDTLAMEAAIRYKHDMADAHAMMAARSNSNKQFSNNSRNDRNTASVSPSKVREALHALDRAEALDQQSSNNSSSNSNNSSSSGIHRYFFGSGSSSASSVDTQQRQALQLYQDAIQILIQYLRQPPSSSSSPPQNELDRSALQERIQTALTDAENLKAKIDARENQQQQQQQSSGTPKPPQTSPLASLFPFGGNNANNNSSNNEKQNTEQKQTGIQPLSSSSLQPTSRRTGRRPSSGRTTGSSASQRVEGGTEASRRKTKKTPLQPAPPPSSSLHEKPNHQPTQAAPNKSSSKSAAANQELQHQILDDFYVPSSTLQKTTWDDVAGLKDVKQALQESVILPLQRPDLFQGLRRPQNLLLYGPPGTGKTLLVRATASTSRALLFQCSAASLTSKWMGDAEKVVRALFQVAAAAARQHQTPALLFLDEVDSVLSNRHENEHEASRRLKTEFMIQMEGLAKRSDHDDDNSGNHNVLVLACTNCPWDLDPAVLRRFPRRLYVPLPDVEARRALLQHLLETQLKNDHSLTSRDVQELALELEGYSGSDIYAIASQAAFGPIREVSAQQLSTVQKLRPVSRQDWTLAMEAAPPPSVTPKLLQHYQEWQTRHNK